MWTIKAKKLIMYLYFFKFFKRHTLISNQVFSRTLFLILSLSIVFTTFSQGNNLIEISGTVANQETKEPIPAVSVQIKGTIAGTTTNNAGEFSIKTKSSFPLTLVFSSVGFEPQEFEVKSINSKLAINLVTQTVLGKEVVVTASRVAESILKSPVAIEKLDIRAIRESPAPSFYDALENVKGVQMTTSSLTFKVPKRLSISLKIDSSSRLSL